MPTFALTAEQSLWVGVLLLVVSPLLRLVVRPRVAWIATLAFEGGLIAFLFGMWARVGALSVMGTEHAYDRAHWLSRVERDLPLPDQAAMVHWLVRHRHLAEAANYFYATMHFTVMGLLLLWLFIRHRERYAEVRTTMVLFTAMALAVQLIPVAPPRLLPDEGFVDVAQQFGQSVYGGYGAFNPNQLSAMPSVHVGWCLLVAWAVIISSPSRWRWLIVIHPLLTIYVVVATANHFWLDGIVAAVLLVIARGLERLLHRLVVYVRQRVGRRTSGRREAADEPAEPVSVPS